MTYADSCQDFDRRGRVGRIVLGTAPPRTVVGRMKSSAIERELHHCMTARNKRLKRGKPRGRKDATLNAWLDKIHREIRRSELWRKYGR